MRGLDSGRMEVRLGADQLAQPLRSREDLEELSFFLGAGAAPLAHPGLAAALQKMARAGWQFRASRGEATGIVGAYGAYNALTDASHGLTGLVASREGCELPCQSSAQLEEWAGLCELPGTKGAMAARAGPRAEKVFEEEGCQPADTVRRLRQQGLAAEAAAVAEVSLSGDHPQARLFEAARDLDSPALAALGQALLERPEDPVAAVRHAIGELGQGDWRDQWHAAELGRILLPLLVPPDSPLPDLVASIWDEMANWESRQALVEVLLQHLDVKEPESLRRLGLEAMAAVKSRGYYVQAARLGAAFAAAAPPPELPWVRDVVPKLFADDSRSAVYRQLLASPLEKPTLFSRALGQIEYDEDGIKLALHALGQLTEKSPGLAFVEDLVLHSGLSKTGAQCLVQAALETPGASSPAEISAVGLRAVRLMRSARDPDCQAERDIFLCFLRRQGDAPLARAALEMASSSWMVPSQNALYEAALARPEAASVDARFVEEVLQGVSSLDRQRAVRDVAHYLREHSPDPRLRSALEKLPLDADDLEKRLLQEFRVAADLRLWQEQLGSTGENGGVKADQNYVWVNGVPVPVRKPGPGARPPGAESLRPAPPG
ncbi:MAG: hypothetical protein HY319_13355 [Armatimonadetes bacterium]|nr:hypothetical protein [Armatimonadota bacterium]